MQHQRQSSVSQGQHDQMPPPPRLTPAPVCWVCREWGVGGEGRHARRRQVNAAAGQDQCFTSYAASIMTGFE